MRNLPAYEPTMITLPVSFMKGSIFSVNSTVPKKFVYSVVFTMFSLKSSPLKAMPALLSKISTLPNF